MSFPRHCSGRTRKCAGAGREGGMDLKQAGDPLRKDGALAARDGWIVLCQGLRLAVFDQSTLVVAHPLIGLAEVGVRIDAFGVDGQRTTEAVGRGAELVAGRRNRALSAK